MRDGLGLTDGLQRVDDVCRSWREKCEDSFPGGAVSVTGNNEHF